MAPLMKRERRKKELAFRAVTKSKKGLGTIRLVVLMGRLRTTQELHVKTSSWGEIPYWFKVDGVPISRNPNQNAVGLPAGYCKRSSRQWESLEQIEERRHGVVE